MTHVKNLNSYEKCVLLLLAVMLVVFTPIYSVVSSKEGFEYKGTMLYPSVDEDTTVYNGKLNGKEVSFTVALDKVITFQYGDKIYGPYIVREDASAIPKGLPNAERMTGVEILVGEIVYFRGGMRVTVGGKRSLYGQGDLSNANYQGISYSTAGFDSMAPAPVVILELADGPQLTSRGDWGNWLRCVLASVLMAIGILRDKKLVRNNMSSQIGDVNILGSSERAFVIRYIGLTCVSVLILIMYIAGLKL